MGTITDDHDFVELDRHECVELLRLEEVGRLALPDGFRAPGVYPVNYVMHGDEPVFRTHRSLLLERVLHGPVTLQVDRIDWVHRTGWTVMVQGSAHVVDAADLGDEPPDSWLPGDQDHFVRIRPVGVSGRRIEVRHTDDDERGYL